MLYTNPIIPGFFPDPSICKNGDDYYLVTSTFEYYPAVPLFHSKDLINWRFVRYILDRPDQIDLQTVPSSSGIFACSIRYHEGMYYMVTTNVNGCGHFYVTAKDPSEPWSKPIFVDGPGFDPDLFFDDDGKVYFIREDISSYGIHLFQIDISNGKLLSPDKLLWEGAEDPLCEAPHLYKINGWYYLLTAEGGTYRGHMVTMARSRSILGPYESCPNNPILTHRHLVLNKLQSLGHSDLVLGPNGSWFLVFLGTRPIGKFHHLGRETFLAPVQFTDDGWLKVNNGTPIDTVMDLPYEYESQENDTCVIEYFKSNTLSNWFNYRRNPKQDAYSIDQKLHALKIRNLQTKEDIDHFSFVGVRQRDFSIVCETIVELDHQAGAFAGLMCIMNENHYYSFGPCFVDGKMILRVKKMVGDMIVQYDTFLTDNSKVSLKMVVSPKKIEFHTQDTMLGCGDIYLLSSEVAGGFTGLYLGMFNASASPQSNATFYFFSYKKILPELSK